MKIEVKTIAGPNCITLEDGQAVYDKIHPELKSGRHVELNFQGVQVFASPFFNAAVGQLLKDIPAKDLNNLLEVLELAPTGRDTLKQVLDNSRQYYASERSKAIIEDVLKREE